MSYPIPILNAAYYLGYFIGGRILYEKYKDKKFLDIIPSIFTDIIKNLVK